VTRSGRIAGGVAVAAATVAVVLAGVDGRSTLLGVAGAVVLVAGVAARRRSLVTAGAAGLGTSVLLAGLAGASAPGLVAATAAVVVAWTLGQTRVALAPYDPNARTAPFEYAQVAGVTVVASAAGGLALAPRAVEVDASPVGVALVLFGGVALTGTLLVEA